MMTNAIIVCPGPSLDLQLIPKLLDLGDCYAINRALLAFPDHTKAILTYVDRDVLMPELKQDFANPEQRKLTTNRYHNHHPNTTIIELYHQTGKAKPVVDFPFKSPLVAYHYLRSRYKSLYFAGMDCKATKENLYFFPYDTTRTRIHGKGGRNRSYEITFRYLSRWIKEDAELGLAVYNLSPGSRLEEIMETIEL